MLLSKRQDIVGGTSQSYTITPRNPKMTVTDFMADAKPEALKLMNKLNNEQKFRMVLSTKLKRLRLLGNNSDYKDTYTPTKNEILYPLTNTDEVYEDGSEKIKTIFLKKEHEGSGWTLEKINHLELKFDKV